jgi:hypothetical protein
MLDTEVLVAIIAANSAVLVALIGVGLPMLVSARKHAKQANEQVTNDHATNLRVESDERHSENASRLGRLERKVTDQGRAIGKIATHLGIEDTIPNTPNRRARPNV